jgi:hypothetical protein
MLKHLQFSGKEIISAIFLLFFSSLAGASVPNNQAKIAQAAVSISQTTAPATQPRRDSIGVTATNIVNEWAQEDPDFTTSCGIQADCYSFWLIQFELELTAQVEAQDAILEMQRQNRCSDAATSFAARNCGTRDLFPPAHDFAIRYSALTQHNFFRPIIRDFQTQIFNDATGNSINNFSSALTQMRAACEVNLTLNLDRFFCRNDADIYFGQQLLGGGGLQNFLNSPAATDATPSLYGNACNAIRARQAADRCST